jgi:hypothetical protein
LKFDLRVIIIFLYNENDYHGISFIFLSFLGTSMQRSLFSLSRILSSAALFTMLAAFSTPSLAQLVTDDTEIQGSGGFRIETTYGRDRTRVDGESERANSILVTHYYGVTDNVDVFASVGYSGIYASGSHVHGFNNATVGVKWLFFDNEASGTTLAIRPEIAIPVSSRREDNGLGTGKTSGNLNFILSQEVPFGAINVNAGVGRDRFRHSDDNATNRHFSVAPVWQISEQWQLVFDTGIDLTRSGGNTVRSKFVAASVVYLPSEDVDLEVGYMRASDNENPKAKTYSIGVILNLRF